MRTAKNYYYLTENTYDKKTGHTFSIREEIPQEDVDEMFSHLRVTSIYNSITQIRDIVVQNGDNFQKYVLEKNLQRLRQQQVDVKTIILNSNRLVLNYASSLKTYIDMETRLLSRQNKKDELKLFQQLCSEFYDSRKEYRFWMNFRDYVVHCEFPYHGFVESLEDGYKLICTKEHLLGYKKWKHSKADILEMGDNIDLSSMVFEMSALIMALYLNFLAYFAKEITDSISYYSKFCQKHNVKSQTFLVTSKKVSKDNRDEAIEAYKTARLIPLPIKELFEAFEQLENNPNVKITKNII